MLDTAACAVVRSSGGGTGAPAAVSSAGAVSLVCAAGLLRGDGHEDRKHPAGEPALPGHRQVELSLALAVEECARRIGAFALPQAQQRVVVSVEDRHRPG